MARSLSELEEIFQIEKIIINKAKIATIQVQRNPIRN